MDTSGYVERLVLVPSSAALRRIAHLSSPSVGLAKSHLSIYSCSLNKRFIQSVLFVRIGNRFSYILNSNLYQIYLFYFPLTLYKPCNFSKSNYNNLYAKPTPANTIQALIDVKFRLATLQRVSLTLPSARLAKGAALISLAKWLAEFYGRGWLINIGEWPAARSLPK